MKAFIIFPAVLLLTSCSMPTVNESQKQSFHQTLLQQKNKIINLVSGKLMLGSSYGDLGLSLTKQGKYADALKQYEKALEIRKQTLGEVHIRVARTYNNIGFLHDKLGDFQEAIENYSKALEINQKLHNEQDIARNHNNLGLVYTQLGDFQKALDHYNKSLKLSKKYNNNRDIVVNYINIAFTYENWWFYFDKSRLDLKDKALDYYRKALSLCDKKCTSMKNCANTIYIHSNLGFLYNRLNMFDKALYHSNLALKLRKKIYGKQHLELSTSYNNLGLIYENIAQKGSAESSQENFKKALEYQKKALAIRESLFGKNHTSTGITYLNIGNAYAGLKQYKESYIYTKQAYDIYHRDSTKYSTMFDTAQKHDFIKLRRDEMGALLKAAFLAQAHL